MRRGQVTWIVVIGVAVIVSIFMLYPTFSFYSMSRQQQTDLRRTDPTTFYSLKGRAMRLGLDLQGGVHMVLQVKNPRGGAVSKDVVDQVKNILEIRVDKFGIVEPDIRSTGTDQIVVDLPGYTDIDTAKALIGSTAQLQFKLLRSVDETQKLYDAIDSVIVAKQLAENPAAAAKAQAAAKADTSKAANIFKNETANDTGGQQTEEQFGEKHPFSTLVTSSGGYGSEVAMDDFYKVQQYLEMPEVKAVIPPNYQLTWATRAVKRGDRNFQLLYNLNSNVEMSGEYLVSAKEAYSQMREPEVRFELNSDGAKRFGSLTGKHISEPLAIVIDERVESAPTIQSRITRSGVITMGGNASINDAYLLAVLLKAGALPASVDILQSTVIGPALGQDSINKGKMASIIGIILVVIFMAFYYKISGLIADLGVVLNTFFILAFMVIPGVNSTLTMPGIAGIILTVGMSVDSNVLIFERIREELRTGKTIRAAIDAGYDRALLTVIDSHVTTLITALFLFVFGSGPVRGFAVTLSVGIRLSLFTAIFVTKTIFDLRKQYKSLSI